METTTGVAAHPAQYSEELLLPMIELLSGPAYLLPERAIYDPMAGRGDRLARLGELLGLRVSGSELEPEWIAHPFIAVRDCRDYFGEHDIIVTSPAYGNRLADQYLGTPEERLKRAADGKIPRRRSYAILLGRKLSEGNGAGIQWGAEYRDLHTRIMCHVVHNNLRPGGYFLLNIGSHFRGGKYQPVSEWFLELMLSTGLTLSESRYIETRGYRDGANRNDRVGGEHLYLFTKGKQGG